MSTFDDWDSRKAIISIANHAQTATDIKWLKIMSNLDSQSSKLFARAGEGRKARICQLKSEMFAARAKELAMPKCSICGQPFQAKGNTCETCYWWTWTETFKLYFMRGVTQENAT